MRTIRTITLYTLFLLGLPIVLANIGATLLMRRRKPDPTDTPEMHDIPYEEVTFPSRGDHTKIVGWWIPAKEGEKNARGTIVMCHGQSGSMDRDTRRMIPLHKAGYNVLMFDFRAHGRSAGNEVTFGMYEKEDLLGALDYVVDVRGIQKVGLYGFSMGAATALITAALSERVVCVVADSPFGRLTRSVAGWWRRKGVPIPLAREIARWILMMCTIRTAGRIDQTDPVRWTVHIGPRPIFYIFGARDPYISKREIRRMVSLTAGPTSVWTVERAGHRGAYGQNPDEYNRRVREWFDQFLVE